MTPTRKAPSRKRAAAPPRARAPAEGRETKGRETKASSAVPRTVGLWPPKKVDSRPKLAGARLTEARVDFINAFKALDRAATEVARRLKGEDRNLPAVLYLDTGTVTGRDAREKAATAVTLYLYKDSGPGKESLKSPGVLCASPATVAAVRELNAAKDALKTAIVAIPKSQRVKVFDALGKGRLHRRQAERRMHVFPAAPDALGFYWVRKQGDYLPLTRGASPGGKRRRAGSRDWVDSVLNGLKDRNPEAAADLEKLRNTPDSVELLVVREGTPCVLVTARYGAEQKGAYTFLPVVIAGRTLPDALTALKEADETQERQTRQDVSIERYLKTVPVYRRTRKGQRGGGPP